MVGCIALGEAEAEAGRPLSWRPALDKICRSLKNKFQNSQGYPEKPPELHRKTKPCFKTNTETRLYLVLALKK